MFVYVTGVNKDLFGESDCSEGNDVEEESELEEVSEEDDFDTDFRSHKDNYYMDKMKLQATPYVLNIMASCKTVVAPAQ